MAKLQSDRYERDYFHKIWVEYYCLRENCGSDTLSLKNSLGVKIHTSCKTSKFCQHFRGIKYDMGKNFYLKGQGYVDITRTKINLGSHHLHT